MKRTVFPNTEVLYSLHDMTIERIEVDENNVVLRMQSGLIRTTPICEQVDGTVEFRDVQWDFSYVYLLDFTGNVGVFHGEKMFFKDFIERYPTPYLNVFDESYGYNTVKYSGYLTVNGRVHECLIEIYHEGNMIVATEELEYKAD